MNTLDFILKLIEIIIWPAVVLSVLIFARKEIKKLLNNLKILKYKGLEADFSEKLQKLEQQAKNAISPNLFHSARFPQLNENPDDTLERLMYISPRVAVIESFNYVDEAIRKAGIKLGIASDRLFGVRNILSEFRKRNLIPDKIFYLFSELRETRNSLSHSAKIDISKVDADNFIATAKFLANVFSNL